MSSINTNNDNSTLVQYNQPTEAERERTRSSTAAGHGAAGVKALQPGAIVGDASNNAASNSGQIHAQSTVPNLPDPQGKSATPEQTNRAILSSSSFVAGGDSIFAALDALTKMSQQNYKTAQKLKYAQNKIAADAKMSEYYAKEDEIHGNRVSAVTQLIGNIAGGALAAGLGFWGVKQELGSMSGSSQVATSGKENQAGSSGAGKSNSANAGGSTAQAGDRNTPAAQSADRKDKAKREKADDFENDIIAGQEKTREAAGDGADSSKTKRALDEKQEKEQALETSQGEDSSLPPGTKLGDETADSKAAWGSAMKSAGFSASQIASSFVNMMDTLVGGKHEADQAGLEQKLWAVRGQIAQTNADQAGSWADQAKDQRKGAQDAMLRHVQMWGDSITNLWR